MKNKEQTQTIVVKLETWHKLRKLKLGPGETFDLAINKLFDMIEELKRRNK